MYIESSFYTTCDCDPDGDKRSKGGPSWWSTSTICSDWRCIQVSLPRRAATPSSTAPIASRREKGDSDLTFCLGEARPEPRELG